MAAYDLTPLSLRDQFAMAALTGLLAGQYSPDGVAASAYEVADAMLKARVVPDEDVKF